jgi:hypothetical protein
MWQPSDPSESKLLCFLLVLWDVLLTCQFPIQHDVKLGCLSGLISPKPPHLLNAYQIVPRIAMPHRVLPVIKRIHPRMDLRKRLPKLTLAILAMLLVAGHGLMANK